MGGLSRAGERRDAPFARSRCSTDRRSQCHLTVGSRDPGDAFAVRADGPVGVERRSSVEFPTTAAAGRLGVVIVDEVPLFAVAAPHVTGTAGDVRRVGGRYGRRVRVLNAHRSSHIRAALLKFYGQLY